jgi:hypothetical protein
MPRPISKQEIALIERVLSIGANEPISPALIAAVPSLQVTATCNCGCATVWFGPDGNATVAHNLAEVAASADGCPVTVIAWSQGDAIVGLEIVGYEEQPAGLPNPLTVRRYGEA